MPTAIATPQPASLPVRLTSRPRDLVAEVKSRLVRPSSPEEQQRFDHLAGLLCLRDGAGAAALLDQPFERAGGAVPQLPCYVLAVMACCSFERHAVVLPGRDQLQRTIRHQARAELVNLPWQADGAWLVPAKASHRTEAHVAALLLISAGETTRPWLWTGLPLRGRFHVIGKGSENHPAADHLRCDGVVDIHQIAARCGAAIP